MGIFAGADKAEVFGKGQNIRPGDHILRVIKQIPHQSRRSAGVSFAVHEFEIVKSEGGRQLSAKEGSPLAEKMSKPHKPGERVSWVIKMIGQQAINNICEYNGALLGELGRKFTESDLDELYSEEQPTAGMLVRADAFMIVTREKGNDFCAITWRPVEPSDLDV